MFFLFILQEHPSVIAPAVCIPSVFLVLSFINLMTIFLGAML